jgi:Cys-tRNA synthase (O-phospho-L-seryl-tRNA:Cys-tRNA synthase)
MGLKNKGKRMKLVKRKGLRSLLIELSLRLMARESMRGLKRKGRGGIKKGQSRWLKQFTFILSDESAEEGRFINTQTNRR